MEYTGSHLLLPLSKAVGMPIDQVNFVVAQSSGILLGFLLRAVLPHSVNKPKWRLLYCLACGLAFLLFLIGKSVWVLLLQIMVCYAIMKYSPHRFMQMSVFVFALGYMIANYIIRFNVEIACYDETYPLMVTTQKLTSLAFGLSDWRMLQKGKKMDPERQKWAVRELPSLLEFLAFTLSFQGVLAGPFCHWNLYRAFIEGNTKARLSENTKYPVRYEDDPSTCRRAVATKILAVVFWTYISTAVKPIYPDSQNADADFIASHGIFYRLFYVYISLFLHRAKYYVTWILADAVYNASGLGYVGKDENGQAQWTGMSNVQVVKIETAPSLKLLLDNWNIMTSQWLRHVCYSRAPFLNTLLTFILSALWHGVHAAYYVTFVAAAFCVQAGRKVRANIRPKFQGSRWSQLLYDVMTTVATQITLSFLVFSFVIHDLPDILRFHQSFYFGLYIAVGCALVFLPRHKKRQPASQNVEDPPDGKADTSGQQPKQNGSRGVEHREGNTSLDTNRSVKKREGEYMHIS